MTPLAIYRAFFVQVVTGYAEFMGCRLSPVGYLAILLVVTLPALILGQFLMLAMSEVEHFIAHLQLDHIRTGIFRLGRKQ